MPTTEDNPQDERPVKLQEGDEGLLGGKEGEGESQLDDSKEHGKPKKRSFFGLGKKKEAASKSTTATSGLSFSSDSSKLPSTSGQAISPLSSQADPLILTPTTPNRNFDSSSRLVSPAGSQIFERNVQDSTILQPNSPAIPTHIQTENYIPPVLDHASEAITNETLHPDSVEIVTHSSHQPAAVTVTSGGLVPTPREPTFDDLVTDSLAPADHREAVSGPDNASSYGALDSSDIRRLSFISFADVVQSEHDAMPGGPSSRDSMYLAGMNPISSSGNPNRSPSPNRSPISTQGPGVSPPTSNPSSVKGVEMSPSRKALGSPTSLGPPSLTAPGSELNVETMTQALRRTGSTDLSSFRSVPASPIEPPGSR